MTGRALLIAFGCAGALQGSAVAQTASAGVDARRIDRVVETVITERRIPGAAVAVTRGERLLYAGGYGVASLEPPRPVTTSTIFQLASTTKPFTAMAVLLLHQEGRLGLDTPVAHYLDWLPPEYATVTVRQLLWHTSGVARDLRRENVDEFSLDEFRRRLRAAPPSFEPGERWEYSNTGYALLSFVVEKVSGQDFGVFLRKRIFEPLAMVATGYRVPETGDARHAVGYDLVDGEIKRAPHVFSGWGNSGIESNVLDLARWATAIMRQDLLDAESYATMFRAAGTSEGRTISFTFNDAPSSYGAGWFLTEFGGRRLHTHGGAIAGFSSVVNLYPDDSLAVVVLSNGKQGADRSGQAQALADAIAPLVLGDRSASVDSQEEATWREVAAANRAMEAAVNSGDPLTAAGFYADDAVIRNGERVVAQGRAAIDQYFSEIGPATWILEVRDVGGDPDVPYQVGRSTLIHGTPPDTTTVDFVVYWRRQTDGRLRIALDYYHRPCVRPSSRSRAQRRSLCARCAARAS